MFNLFNKKNKTTEKTYSQYELFCSGNTANDFYYETVTNPDGVEELSFIAFRERYSRGQRGQHDGFAITSLKIKDKAENIENVQLVHGTVNWDINYDRPQAQGYHYPSSSWAQYGDYEYQYQEHFPFEIFKEIRFGKISLETFKNSDDYRFCVKSLLEKSRVKDRYLLESMVLGIKEYGNYIGYVGEDLDKEYDYRPYTNPAVGEVVHYLPDIEEKRKLIEQTVIIQNNATQNKSR